MMLAVRLQLASCLINAQTLPAHRPAADDWQMIGRCPVPRAVPVPISLTADAHFSARLGAFFYWTRCFETIVSFDTTTPIYLINMLWKLGLGFGLNSELHYISIFMDNKEDEHLISRKFHGR